MDTVLDIIETLAGLLLVAGAFFWVASRIGNHPLDH